MYFFNKILKILPRIEVSFLRNGSRDNQVNSACVFSLDPMMYRKSSRAMPRPTSIQQPPFTSRKAPKT